MVVRTAEVNGNRNLPQSLERGGNTLVPLPELLVDGLDHDDGIVHQHAQADDHREQRRGVEGLPQHRQDGEGARERERDADAGQQSDAEPEETPRR